MKIVVAHHAGACYGVNRALKLARQAAHHSSNVFTLGPLIHNPQVVEQLAGSGICVTENLDEVESGSTLVIRSHGVVPRVIEEARAKGLEVVNATCPHVSKAHRAASELNEQGYSVIVVGEAGHPEVEGICAYAGGDVIVVSQAVDLPSALPPRVGIVVQTTQSKRVLDEITAALVDKVKELKVCDTICFATQQRQQSAAALASAVDVMLVIGGRNSGNTRRLHEICSDSCARSYHIETPEEIEPAWFEGCEIVGITAGASTPAEQIDAVISALEAL